MTDRDGSLGSSNYGEAVASVKVVLLRRGVL